MWRSCFRMMVLVAMCFCSLAESQSDIFQFPDKRLENKRYCGNNLVDILQFVCNGYYYSNINSNNSYNYSPHAGRKKSVPEVDEDLWREIEPVDEHLKFPFRSRSSASTFLHRIFKRHAVGVAYECCISKGCTIHELRSYCGP